MSHPRVAHERNSVGLIGRERRAEAVSITEMPRLYFPPSVLCLRDWGDEKGQLANDPWGAKT